MVKQEREKITKYKLINGLGWDVWLLITVSNSHYRFVVLIRFPIDSWLCVVISFTGWWLLNGMLPLFWLVVTCFVTFFVAFMRYFSTFRYSEWSLVAVISLSFLIFIPRMQRGGFLFISVTDLIIRYAIGWSLLFSSDLLINKDRCYHCNNALITYFIFRCNDASIYFFYLLKPFIFFVNYLDGYQFIFKRLPH